MKYKLSKKDKDVTIHLKELEKLKKEVDYIVKYDSCTLSIDLVDLCNSVTYFTSSELPKNKVYKNSNGDRITLLRDYLTIQTGINKNGYENTLKRDYVIHLERKGLIKPYRCRETSEYEGNVNNIYCLADNIKDCIIEFKKRYSLEIDNSY